MRFEVLVEDRSGAVTVGHVLRTLLGGRGHTLAIHPFRGVGKLPKDIHLAPNPAHQQLLAQLPAWLRGYGRAMEKGEDMAVIVVLDSDDHDPDEMRRELGALLSACQPTPRVRFCLATEEIEAWLLGDRDAVLAAYPRADVFLLQSYTPDSVCGTWEVLGRAVDPQRMASLPPRAFHIAGRYKAEWAERIAPHVRLRRSRSPSFRSFADKVLHLASRSGV